MYCFASSFMRTRARLYRGACGLTSRFVVVHGSAAGVSERKLTMPRNPLYWKCHALDPSCPHPVRALLSAATTTRSLQSTYHPNCSVGTFAEAELSSGGGEAIPATISTLTPSSW